MLAEFAMYFPRGSRYNLLKPQINSSLILPFHLRLKLPIHWIVIYNRSIYLEPVWYLERYRKLWQSCPESRGKPQAHRAAPPSHKGDDHKGAVLNTAKRGLNLSTTSSTLPTLSVETVVALVALIFSRRRQICLNSGPRYINDAAQNPIQG
jgi:hypothetical protein